jgi:hypothetical protein
MPYATLLRVENGSSAAVITTSKGTVLRPVVAAGSASLPVACGVEAAAEVTASALLPVRRSVGSPHSELHRCRSSIGDR